MLYMLYVFMQATLINIKHMDMVIFENIDIHKEILKNIDKKSLRNIDIDIDKGIKKISIK